MAFKQLLDLIDFNGAPRMAALVARHQQEIAEAQTAFGADPMALLNMARQQVLEIVQLGSELERGSVAVQECAINERDVNALAERHRKEIQTLKDRPASFDRIVEMSSRHYQELADLVLSRSSAEGEKMLRTDAVGKLRDYPNLQALVIGTASGDFADWPAMRNELLQLMAVARSAAANLTFRDFSRISLSRAMRWHKGGIEEWSESEWCNALGGEVGEAAGALAMFFEEQNTTALAMLKMINRTGEAANASKKLLRLLKGNQQHDGDSKVPKNIEEARTKIAKEIGDSISYADLVCHRIGWTLEDALRLAFNSVSEREHFPERI